ncbi:hypothetical protein [Paenibacillus koleovorans]|uniref:hypothetical protein n=1 Tax=Paenibacillus koleovorans TaxID=121608 RepID=UPI000FD8168B|nr:hypothetical protein [Paenibacillus koleovorans]
MLFSIWKVGGARVGHNRKRLAAGGLIVLLLAAAQGCGISGGDPGELFDNTVSGLSGKDNFTFIGKTQSSVNGMPPQPGINFKGTVTGHNQMQMQVLDPGRQPSSSGTVPMQATSEAVVFNRSQDKWLVTEDGANANAGQLLRLNPMVHLERLNVMQKQVDAGRRAEQPGVTLLSVHPDARQATGMVTEGIDEQLRALDTEKKLEELRKQFHLTDKQKAAMRIEVEASLAEARGSLEEVKRSLQAEMQYVIGVDRKTNLPTTMQVKTVMHYSKGGQPKEETSLVEYAFTD